MIDLDRIEAQLAAAVIEEAVSPRTAARRAPAPAPTPAPAPSASRPRRSRTQPAPAPAPRSTSRPAPARPQPAPAGVRELLELGMLDQVDARIAAAGDRLDQTTWATMRALLRGNRDAVKVGADTLTRLGQDGDAEALARAWTVRFWAAVEWGAADERYDLLDHCRERAYRFDDLTWWGNLTLLLAVLGKQDEAVRAFDLALPLAAGAPQDGIRLDAVTNLVEAAAVLGDAGRVALAGRQLRTPTGRLVVVGDGVVCKGSVDRYVALIHAGAGQFGDAARSFRSAEATHRDLEAEPLLARTRHQASGILVAA